MSINELLDEFSNPDAHAFEGYDQQYEDLVKTREEQAAKPIDVIVEFRTISPEEMASCMDKEHVKKETAKGGSMWSLLANMYYQKTTGRDVPSIQVHFNAGKNIAPTFNWK